MSLSAKATFAGMKNNACIRVLQTSLLVLFLSVAVNAQTSKQINKQYQSWFSINNTIKLNSRWAILADFHTRHNDFLAHPSFNIVRGGVQYSVDKNLSVAAGDGHMWLYPTKEGWETISNENRIFEQVIYTSKFRKANVLQRFRNEQRWQQKIENDKRTGNNKFTNRFRYLLSLTVPVFKNPKVPSLVVADEVLLQAGKEVVNNTLDQNRIFIGVKEQLTPSLSFDTGYMLVFQQKSSGYQYDKNNTFRLFFYYSPQLYKTAKTK